MLFIIIVMSVGAGMHQLFIDEGIINAEYACPIVETKAPTTDSKSTFLITTTHLDENFFIQPVSF